MNVKERLRDIYNNDTQNTILECYSQATKNYDYLDLKTDEQKKEYFESVILNDSVFLKEVEEVLD